MLAQLKLKLARHIKHPHFKVVLPIAWGGLTFFSTIAALSLLLVSVSKPAYLQNLKYSVYSANPLVLGDSSTRISQGDSRAESIDRVMAFYKCPMTGLGDKFVQEADKNNIPYWVVASIAFQESSCGKNTPIKNGEETYNAYGYGVWGEHIKAFKTWEHGIEVMSVYMSEMFYSQNITELCEIMKTYTPPSKGSWCAGVGHFRDQILGYETPNAKFFELYTE